MSDISNAIVYCSDDEQENITELHGKEAEDFILAVQEIINGCQDGKIEGEYFEF